MIEHNAGGDTLAVTTVAGERKPSDQAPAAVEVEDPDAAIIKPKSGSPPAAEPPLRLRPWWIPTATN